MGSPAHQVVSLEFQAKSNVDKAAKDAVDSINKIKPAAQNAGAAVASSMNGMERVFGGLKTGLAAIGFGLGAAEIVSGARAAINEMDALRDTALKTGLAIKDVAGLDFAAKLSGGTGAADFVVVLRNINRALGEAKSNVGGDAAEAFSALAAAMGDAGLEAENFGKLAPIDQIEKLMDAISGLSESNDNNVAMMRLAGRSMADLKGMAIDAGEGGIGALRREFDSFGLDAERAAAAADNFNDALIRLATRGKISAFVFGSQVVEGFKRFQEILGTAAFNISQGQTAATSGITADKLREEREAAANYQRIREVMIQKGRELESKELRLKTDAEKQAATDSASAQKRAAEEAAQKIKQAQESALNYIADLREKDLEKTVAGLRILEAETVAKYQGIGLSAVQMETLRAAAHADANAKIKVLEDDRFKRIEDAERAAMDAMKKRNEAAVRYAAEELAATERSIQRAAELANVRLGIRQDLGQVGAPGAEMEAFANQERERQASLAALRANQLSLPAGEEGNAARLANMQAIEDLQHRSALATEEHNAAMIRLGSSTQSWAAGARVAFQGWMEQHSAFNTAAAAMTSAIDGIASSTTSLFMGIVDGSKRGIAAFKDFAKNLLKMLAEILIKALMTAAVMALIGIVFPAAPVAAAGIGAAGQAGAASTRGGAFGVIGSVFGGGGKTAPQLMTMPNGKSAMGAGSGGGDSGSQIINVYNIEATDADSFARKMMERPAQDVLSGTMAKNLRGNAGVRGAARS